MTELLPAGDKVDIFLQEDEQVSVPDGKVWVVSVLAHEGGELKFDPAHGRDALRGADNNVDSSISKITLHEGTTLESRTWETTITGWEFEYEEGE